MVELVNPMTRPERNQTPIRSAADNARSPDPLSAARAEASTIRRAATSPTPNPPAEQIAGYSLLRRIGAGGQGVVYEAVQQSTGRRVALKLVDLTGRGPSGWDRFQREIHLLARLNHPSIVTVYDSGRIDDRLFLTMELIEGRPVDEFAFHAGLPRRDTLDLFARICDAVHAAHQRGVIHRDLKPANILVDESGSPHVLDFGLAKRIPAAGDAATQTAMTASGQFVGTLAWASPEQISGSPDDVDVRTDVYSLGAVLFHLLTDATPYDVDVPLREVTENIVRAEPRRPSEFDRTIDDDLETIVLRCLSKEPARRYGSVGELAADIRRYLAGEPIEAKRDSRLYVLAKTLRRHRILVGSGAAALLLGLCFGAVMTVLYQQAREGEQQAVAEAAELREELQKLKRDLLAPANWTSAFSTARALDRLSPQEGLQLLESAWAEMKQDAPKQQLLKAAYVAKPDYLVRALHLGMSDPSAAVQNWSIQYLREIAFRDFSEDFASYAGWYDAHREKPLAETVVANFRDFLARVRAAAGPQRGRLLALAQNSSVWRDVPALARTAADEGFVELLMDLLTARDTDRDTRRAAQRILSTLPLSAELACRQLLPLLESNDEEAADSALNILGSQKAACAIDPIIAWMMRQFATADGRRELSDAADALGEIGDPRVIPTLIAMIEADNTYDTIYGIGYFGLGELTGVQYDESHDGAWWRDWWSRNRARFPESVRGQDIPQLDLPKLAGRQAPSGKPTSPAAAGRTDAEAASQARPPLPVQDLLAGGDVHKRYFLIGPRGPQRPADALGLLLVLPGGDGSAEFHPFVTRIAAQATPDGYLVAQLVAPQWSPGQFEQVVWPTAGLPFDGMEFTTEAFVAAVVKDVAARYQLDEQRIFALGWSSGGPPVYAAALAPDSPLRGALVAMSVFKPDQLATLESGAKGKAFYILHSPEDFIAMRFPESARDRLSAAGARTHLETYDGGHGWHGDVYGHIRRGLDWLAAAE